MASVHNMGLLVLAEAALKRTSERGPESPKNFLKGPSQIESDSDSGTSTGGESCSSGSPSPDINQTVKRDVSPIDIRKFSKFPYDYLDQLLRGTATQDYMTKIILPKTSNSPSSPSAVISELIARKRRKAKQPLPCSFCNKMFNNQSSLRQHESFHRPNRPFKCEEEKCEKAYKTRSELNRHLIVHSGEKKHFCKLCGKKFLRKQYLKTHLLRHHETGITMVTPSSQAIQSMGFPDDVAGKPSMIMSSTALLVAVVPSTFVNEAEPLIWRCQLCLKIFVNNEDLMKHVRSYHEKRRPVFPERETLEKMELKDIKKETVELNDIKVETDTAKMTELKDIKVEPETVEMVELKDIKVEPDTAKMWELKDIQVEPETVEMVELKDIKFEPDTAKMAELKDIQLKPEAMEMVELKDIQVEPDTVEKVQLKDIKIEPEIVEMAELKDIQVEPDTVEMVELKNVKVENETPK